MFVLFKKKCLQVTRNSLLGKTLNKLSSPSAFEFQKIILVTGRLDIFKILKWGCRLGIQDKYTTGNRFRSELQRHVAKSRELDKIRGKNGGRSRHRREG